MKTISATAIVALLAVTAVAPAFAQSAPPAPPAQTQFQHGKDHNGPARADRRGGGMDLLDFARGEEAVEIGLVRLSHRVELTAEQQPKFDAFKAAALQAAADFSTTVEGLRPDREATTRPTVPERLNNRIAIQTAQLEALKAVQPSLTAFFDSLTDQQQAELTPQRPDRNGPGGWHRPMGAPATAPDAAPAG